MFFLRKRKENKTTKPKQDAAIKCLPRASDYTGALTGVTMAPFHSHATTECSLLSRHFLYLSTGALLRSSEFLADRVCKSPLNDTAHL